MAPTRKRFAPHTIEGADDSESSFAPSFANPGVDQAGLSQPLPGFAARPHIIDSDQDRRTAIP
jgi:hypothetical protein